MTRSQIDAVSIRKVGGWELETLSWWLSLTRSEQAGLIKEQRIVFLAQGEHVRTPEALKEIKERLAMAAELEPEPEYEEPVEHVAPEPVLMVDPIPVPPTDAPLPEREYRREVSSGSGWLITVRDSLTGMQESLGGLWGRDPAVDYAWESEVARTRLTLDLVSDACGFDVTMGEPDTFLQTDVQDFMRRRLLEDTLRDTSWEAKAVWLRRWLSREGIITMDEDVFAGSRGRDLS
jgi:hypothetical protein